MLVWILWEADAEIKLGGQKVYWEETPSRKQDLERNAASATIPYGLWRSQIWPLVKKKSRKFLVLWDSGPVYNKEDYFTEPQGFKQILRGCPFQLFIFRQECSESFWW